MVKFRIVKTVDEVAELIDKSEALFKPKRYKRTQFEKYFGDDAEWHGFFQNDVLLALACVKHIPRHMRGMTGCRLVAELQSFKAGAGRELLKHLSKTFCHLWLAVDPDGGRSLAEYYQSVLRPLGWEELEVKHSIFNNGKPQLFWFKTMTRLQKSRMHAFIVKFEKTP